MPKSSAMKVACSIQSSLETHLARPLRIMLTASIPCSVRHAVTSEPYPFASHVRFFTVRWSCSTTLLRYLHCRKRTRRGNVPSPFNAATAAGKAGFCVWFYALSDNRCNASISVARLRRVLHHCMRADPADTDKSLVPRPFGSKITLDRIGRCSNRHMRQIS